MARTSPQSKIFPPAKFLIDSRTASGHRPDMTLHDLIRKSGLRQGEIAELIGVSQGHLSGIKQGHKVMTVENLTALAKALDLTTDQTIAAWKEAREAYVSRQSGDLTGDDRRVLNLLSEENGHTAETLEAHLGVTQSAVFLSIKRLSRRGFAVFGEPTRRSALWFRTPAGSAWVRKHQAP